MAKGEDNPIKYAAINAASGDNEIVAAVSGHRFRILGYTLTATDATAVTFESPTNTVITGVMQLAAKGGIVNPPTHFGCFETATEGAALNLAVTADVDGHLTYQEFSEITT